MSTPFRERNPVVVGAISLAVVLGLILLAFNADKLPIIGGGTPTTPTSARPAASRPTTRCASPASGSARSTRSRWTATTSRSPSGSRAAPTSAPTPGPRSRSRPCSARCTSRSSRPAPASSTGQRDPHLAHPLAVRRGAGVLGPRAHLRADRHPPAGAQPDHAGRPDPQHPEELPPRAGGRLGAVEQPRRAQRADRHPAAEPAQRDAHAERPRPGHRRADARLGGAVPGAGQAAAGDPRPAALDLPALGRADQAGAARAAPT